MSDNINKQQRNNSAEFSGTITNSTISVNQNQDGNQSINEKEIEYAVDKGSYREITSEEYKTRSSVFYISLAVFALGVLADMLGLLTYLGFSHGIIILILAPICWLISVVTKNDRWMNGLYHNNKSYYRDGRWYEKLPNNDVAVYYKRAGCIYPRCDGVVNIVPAPPREHPNHTLVGKCSVGGLQHTYTVDFNSIGYPHKFDWRPLTQENHDV
ncbi:UNVERIFIED_ORG: hypothetical protein DFO82_2403 [Idiomarina abyssalis]|mgnify:CR=1 FL=1|uniref:hypothetical protein n=1 Tax=Idiomarina sp. 017G TaxID=2183988 RepID=UPI000E0E534B|nr:hypothetical protein [Idiomarina sp. 017G]TDO46463.1 hypothetical protein DEU30_11038 [Idiomarina sp. 017G]